MQFFEHQCPSCRCPNTTGPTAWAQANLIPTGNPSDQVKIHEIYWAYRAWSTTNLPNAAVIPTQNRFTRWLSTAGHRVELISGVNRLIGYRLAS
jgi:hypothetical protein